MKLLKRLLKITGGLILFLLLIFVVPLIGVGWQCKIWQNVDPTHSALGGVQAVPSTLQKTIDTLAEYQRPEDQTYLTLPEWYIVYSADEYAAFIDKNPPSNFPYFRAIGQYWRSYYGVCAEVQGRYPFNSGYHLTLAVIGGSFTFENLIRGVYENTVGRLSELLSSSTLSEEDVYARKVATEYGNFIHTIPWYEFPYDEKLNSLWRETSLWGANPIRKWERKLALSMEYGGKSFYARLIKQGTQSTYAPEKLEVYAWVDRLPAQVLNKEADVKKISDMGKEGALISIPRYEAFTQIVPKLVDQGVAFKQIAGNDEILVTAFAANNQPLTFENGTFLFSMPVVIDPSRQRIAVKVAVPSLHLLLKEFTEKEITLEHLYDY
ncbi:MAG: hypothetical protein U0175_00690 [Caldilineaceae bacterium]